jgi:hypothetical protein
MVLDLFVIQPVCAQSRIAEIRYSLAMDSLAIATFCCAVTMCFAAAISDDPQYGKTALILAAENGNAECARLLIEGGADADAADAVSVCVRCLCFFEPGVVWCMLSHQPCASVLFFGTSNASSSHSVCCAI